MLQTLGLRPLPPPRSVSYQLAGGQGCYGNGQLLPQHSTASSELSGSWREQLPGMSFVPVVLLCSPGVLEELMTHLLWIPTSPVTLETFGLWAGRASFLRCSGLQLCAGALPKDALTGKGLSKSDWKRGSLRMGSRRTPVQAPRAPRVPGEQAAPVPGRIWCSSLPHPSPE